MQTESAGLRYISDQICWTMLYNIYIFLFVSILLQTAHLISSKWDLDQTDICIRHRGKCGNLSTYIAHRKGGQGGDEMTSLNVVRDFGDHMHIQRQWTFSVQHSGITHILTTQQSTVTIINLIYSNKINT